MIASAYYNEIDPFAAVRLTEEERTSFDDMAVEHGFANVSEYIRFLHNQHVGAKRPAP